jgi:hypothetical protein
MQRIRLIWDFRGPHAQPLAEHHATHLRSWAAENGYQDSTVGAEQHLPGHWVAWMVVAPECVEDLRRALKPQRGLPV